MQSCKKKKKKCIPGTWPFLVISTYITAHLLCTYALAHKSMCLQTDHISSCLLTSRCQDISTEKCTQIKLTAPFSLTARVMQGATSVKPSSFCSVNKHNCAASAETAFLPRKLFTLTKGSTRKNTTTTLILTTLKIVYLDKLLQSSKAFQFNAQKGK